mgnify:FL=1
MKKTIEEFNLENKKVIIRCDLNVPIKDGVILDDNRIKMSLKTIKYAIDKNAKVILLSHLGRIKNLSDKEKNSLYPISVRLSKLLGQKVFFVNETHGSVVEDAISNMKPKDVILLENTRYEDLPDKKESTCNPILSNYWASLGDIFINDAFGVSHRCHASNVGIAKRLPSGIGFLVQSEMNALNKILKDIKRPYTVILGGAKMNDKIRVINSLVEKADYILLGGGIANTFLVAKGYDLKKSVYDIDSIKVAKELLEKYKEKIILPVDGYEYTKYCDSKNKEYCNLKTVSNNNMVLDIGPETIRIFSKYIKESNTIFFNGPVGVFEFDNFSYGTKKILEEMKYSKAKVIVGGGDSASAAIKFGYKDSFFHISTGGGASLEYISGNAMPGIEVIDDK